ncbi:telethonin-like [Hemiscyllium ocellatum]|uniref:telethonin-like n=1 Tax=Hemiscyllium ocellatum TaxID=170820 RepID=UPI0029662335|nr:telethonin-like [Hemiscyllium ocellatum]
MFSVSKFKRFNVGLPSAALRCDIKEVNSANKEYFTACWQDLMMVTKALNRNALTEDDSTRKEHYGQNQQVTFIVQNSPDQKMRIGRLGEKAVEYQLPYKNVLPVPVFVPCKIKSVTKEDLKPEFSLSLEELRGKERFERALNNTWSFPDKQQVSIMEKELPRIVQPASGNFRASALLSPLNIYSQPEAAHRG